MQPEQKDAQDPMDGSLPPPYGPQRQPPIFNVPTVILILCAIMVAIHALAPVFIRTARGFDIYQLAFSFNPSFFSPVVAATIRDPFISTSWIWSWFSYSFLHGSWLHLGMNMLWMLAFGSVVARRFGTARTVLFWAVSSAAGAAMHFLAYPYEFAPMIGASAVVSGFMGAACRFAFAGRAGGGMSADGPAQTLAQTFANQQALIFIGIWFALNFFFGSGALSMGGEGAPGIAWQAHIGGMLAGLFLFVLFDRRRGTTDV